MSDILKQKIINYLTKFKEATLDEIIENINLEYPTLDSRDNRNKEIERAVEYLIDQHRISNYKGLYMLTEYFFDLLRSDNFTLDSKGYDIFYLRKHDSSWMADAKCRGITNFQELAKHWKTRKKCLIACNSCVVKDECFDYAMCNELVGLWGGVWFDWWGRWKTKLDK